MMKSPTVSDDCFLLHQAPICRLLLISRGPLTRRRHPVTLALSHSESSPPIFHFFPRPWIMNKIIIVCSMKFLSHFPLLMIILFKVYQLENVLCNLNSNDSNKCVWGKKTHNIVSFYCFFLSLEMSSCSPFRGSALYEDATRPPSHL